MRQQPASTRRAKARSQMGAFTLIEVILGVTILALLTGSVYGLLRAAVQTAADLETTEQQDRALHQFIELARSTIESLPPEATMVAALAQEGGTNQELTFAGVYDAFSFGEDPVSSSDLTIGLQLYEPPSGESAEQLYQVSITREDFSPEGEDGEMAVRIGADDELFQADEDGRYWLHLLPDIVFMQWQFWDEEQEIWVDVWEDDSVRPPMVELRIQPSSRGAPLRVVFDVPALVDGTTTTTPATGGGGGGGGTDQPPNANGGGGGGRGPGAGPGGDGGGRGPGGRGPGGGGRGPGFGGPGGDGPRGPGGPGRPPGGGGGGRGPGGGGPGGQGGNAAGGGANGGGGGNAGGGNAGGGGGGNAGGGGAGN